MNTKKIKEIIISKFGDRTFYFYEQPEIQEEVEKHVGYKIPKDTFFKFIDKNFNFLPF